MRIGVPRPWLPGVMCAALLLGAAPGRSGPISAVPPSAPPSSARATATATATSVNAAPENVPGWLHDEAEVFSPSQRIRLSRRLSQLHAATGCEIFVATRIVPNFDGFESACEAIFRDVVKGAGHYKIALVVLGYEGTSKAGVGRGKVYTAIAAGLTQVLSKQSLEGFLSKKGQKVTTESVVGGIEELATALEGFFKRVLSAAVTQPETGTAPAESVRLRIDLVAGIGAVILLVLIVRRMTRCPQCGAKLRKQVKILPAGAEGGSHTVRRTAKCFNCGYVRKGSWL